MKQDTQLTAVIYCRSATQGPSQESMNAQLSRCREYAEQKGYAFLEVFKDEGVSGNAIDRPGMDAMIEFLRDRRNEESFIIIDDISHLARHVDTHIQLRTVLCHAGGKLISPSFEFREDTAGVFTKHVLAGASQHQRLKDEGRE